MNLQKTVSADILVPVPSAREESIFIRVSVEEKAALMDGAATDDRPLSDWLRSLGKKRLKELDLPLTKKVDAKPTTKAPSKKKLRFI